MIWVLIAALAVVLGFMLLMLRPLPAMAEHVGTEDSARKKKDKGGGDLGTPYNLGGDSGATDSCGGDGGGGGGD